MLRNTFTAALLTGLMLAPQNGRAQTAAEQLQKGIFAQESKRDLDAAIVIFRQLANGALPQRDIAAQAQYRLAQALLQKGDAAAAATEIQRLGQIYPDYQNLIRDLSSPRIHAVVTLSTKTGQIQQFIAAQEAPARGPTFERGAFVNISGKVAQTLWMNPVSYLTVDTGGGQFYTFAMSSPNSMMRIGMTRTTLQGDAAVIVTGRLADDGSKKAVSITTATGEKIEGMAIVAQATTILRVADGKTVFDRQQVTATPLLEQK